MTDIRSFLLCLQSAGIENPWKELRHLVAFVTGRLIFPGDEVELTCAETSALESVVLRRAMHEPLTKIMGQASFWKHHFLTTSDTLDPRPESELFIESVLRLVPNRNAMLRFLDLGTGTGCLLLSCLAEYPQAQGVGVDISSSALSVAQANADRLGIRTADFFLSDWNQSVEGTFDIVLSNPPYIRNGESVEAEVLFDPALALFGGEDGLDAYRAIFKTLTRSLKANSLVLLEAGVGQSDAIVSLSKIYTPHLTLVEVVKDLQGILRLLIFRSEGDE